MYLRCSDESGVYVIQTAQISFLNVPGNSHEIVMFWILLQHMGTFGVWCVKDPAGGAFK